MPDFVEGFETSVGSVRIAGGQRNYLAGAAAEDGVLAQCLARGWQCLARRWRGGGGEIDLIFRDGTAYIFVEVKKSDTFEAARERITPRQVARIYRAAEAYLADMPEGMMADTRFDAALVNGRGEVEIMEGALLPY